MSKYDAFGTKLYKGTSSGTLYVNVGNITGPALSLDMVEVTTMDSTAAWEEFVGGLLRSGELTFDIVYDPANATHKNAAGGILADLIARVAITYTLVFPDAATTEWTWSGFFSGFTPDMSVAGALLSSVTVKPTGVVTLV